MARAFKDTNSLENIFCIRSREGTLQHSTDKIDAQFHNFYKKLYDLPASHKPNNFQGDRKHIITEFLKQSSLPSLHPNEIQKLELPLQEDELIQAIKDLKPGKSPGPGGLTSQYYKTFVDILKSPFLANFNYLDTQQKISESFLQAHITVIPKANKDPKDYTSYRPISLLYIDLKLLAKILANCLRPLMKNIGPEQVGFMPEREARDNISKALNPIHSSRLNKIEGLPLSTEAEKTFDRVVWDYMFVTCEH